MDSPIPIRAAERNPDAKPFEGDQLKRESSGETLRELLRNSTPPFVLAIDSPWGTGKTWFLDHWSQQLRENEEFSVIRFNAWENDFSGTPLTALIHEFQSQADNLSKKSNALKRLRKATITIAKATLPLALKLATMGALDATDLVGGSYSKEISGGIAKNSEDAIDAAFKNYAAEKASIEGFRTALKELVAENQKRAEKSKLSSQKEGSDESLQAPRPLVFLVDELDRCRPDFAITLLEAIKHLFNVENVVFVLAIDLEQLSHSISGVYGAKFDGRKYLKRFIDLRFSFPDGASTQEFLAHSWSNFGLSTDQYSFRVMQLLFDIFEFDLRSCEQCLARFAVALRLAPEKNTFDLIAILTAIYEWDSSKFRALVSGKTRASTFITEIGLEELKTDTDTDTDTMQETTALQIQAAITCGTAHLPINKSDWKELLAKPLTQQADKTAIYHRTVRQMIQAQNMGAENWPSLLRQAKQQVELAGNFKR